jgi:predicted HicB family RNase H-like nuclease
LKNFLFHYKIHQQQGGINLIGNKSDEKITFRIPSELKKELTEMAVIDGRSLSNLIINILSGYTDKEKEIIRIRNKKK